MDDFHPGFDGAADFLQLAVGYAVRDKRGQAVERLDRQRGGSRVLQAYPADKTAERFSRKYEIQHVDLQAQLRMDSSISSSFNPISIFRAGPSVCHGEKGSYVPVAASANNAQKGAEPEQRGGLKRPLGGLEFHQRVILAFHPKAAMPCPRFT